MATVNVNVRIDAELKKSADEVMQIAGTTPTQAITLLYQYIAENKRLPFVVTTSVKTPKDLLCESSDLLAESLAVISNLQEWTEKPDGIEKSKLMEYYRRLDVLYCCAKEKIYRLENRREAELALNSLNKAMSIIFDAENFGYGLERVTFSKMEQTNLLFAVQDFERKVSWVVSSTIGM
ncbi:type II toxin-antitoxin system RelB/DinJ family antitoxin [Salmonella enterica subsp. enterica serovar Ealing]|uniref:Type II toxin-antitoxin system RelB/DinJ family antitoxin n=1 Tax=Salmonella enterica TaxID=28901 RepID=A0A5T6HBY0_SALER|nr:type II toxin-antitoxin system RelB/DinJ family antitoxin [Salmonella enterica]ECE6625722.1 type II toxin-antitoxin system antitoxin, RelB/DinJ family [Salmonella enterica subsp. diarizonae]EDF8426215.1 type II toxin-antitoxin system RelB/DinJ family antitoxin [Salmonella enterica subsp. enterica serovar Montevideo]EDH6337856.1 type II toxin-antitoxin system antitoxin, RelB/DinJ family [Salmonella enterica subsp. enterica serovar Enteritidis]EEA4446825.1 type II toxin-antitoxin system RelB/D